MTAANRIMADANIQHHLSVYEAKARQSRRAATKEYRRDRHEKALNAVLVTVSVIGIAMATLFLIGIVAN